MANIELKEIQDAIEDGVKVLKKDWENVREKDQKSFDAKVDGILEDLKNLSSVEQVDEKLVAAKKELQDQFNDLATKLNENGGDLKKAVTFNEALSKSLNDNYEQLKKNMSEKSNFTFEMKDFDWPNFVDGQPYNTEYRNRIIDLPTERFHWRSILPMSRTSRGFVEYPKETALTGAPNAWADVAPRSSKPEFNPNLKVENVKIEWIAGIIKGIPISMLEDLPWLTSFLTSRAYRSLLLAEDNQILNGNGVSPQLNGLLNNASTYNGSYTNMIEMIVDASIRQIGDAHLVATDVIISNTDRVGIILNKAIGSGIYNLPEGSVGYVNGRLEFAGLGLHSTTDMAAGQALVGDFAQTDLILRSEPRLRFFDQNEDDATKNVMMLRIEERAALAVYHDTALVELNASS